MSDELNQPNEEVAASVGAHVVSEEDKAEFQPEPSVEEGEQSEAVEESVESTEAPVENKNLDV